MTCEETVGQLYEYLDSELDKRSYTKVKKHLNACHICCEKFEFEQTLKNIIKAKSEIHKVRESVRENIVMQLSARNRVKRSEETSTQKSENSSLRSIFQIFQLRPAYMAAAVLLPLFITALSVYLVFFKSADYSSPIIAGVAERHDKFISNRDFLNLASSDLSELNKYFKGPRQSNFNIDVPNMKVPAGSFVSLPGKQSRIKRNDLRFLGCKNCDLAGKKSLFVGLEKSSAKMSLEIIDGSGININGLKKEQFGGRPYYFGENKGYNIVLWKQDDTIYSLTSTLHKNDLLQVADGTLYPFFE